MNSSKRFIELTIKHHTGEVGHAETERYRIRQQIPKEMINSIDKEILTTHKTEEESLIYFGSCYYC